MRNKSRVVYALILVFGIIIFAGSSGIRGQAGNTDARVLSTDSGYVFVDGEYLKPPYKVELLESAIQINGTTYDESALNLSARVAQEEFGGGPRGRGIRAGRRRREGNKARRFFSETAALQHGAVVLVDSEEPFQILHPKGRAHDFLSLLLKNGSAEIAGSAKIVISEGERDEWLALADGFRPTDEFLDRAKRQVDQENNKRNKVSSVLAYQRLSKNLMYPLTIVAFVIVVLAVGHLMAIATETFASDENIQSGGTVQATALRSLFIIAVFSIFDLIWTMIAHQVGAMEEMNPVGARLISNPTQLVMFKILMSGGSIGLLYWLRNFEIARKATWWCCLVLTLLTVRWLTFNSLFA